jgi:nucleotide-binding universal stress UspA family protein
MIISRILIAIDDNKYAEHATAYGFELARLHKAEVGLVNIVEPISLPSQGTDTMTGMPIEVSNIDEVEIMKAQSDSAKNIMQQTIKKFAGEMQVTNFTEYGSTADGIINCSKEFNADLIVIGTHSRTGLDRLLMGSVAEHVVRHSDVPVLVVPLKEVD